MERGRLDPLDDTTDELNNVLRLRLASKAQEQNRTRKLGRDWSAALDAVHQASEAMTQTEQRARDIEARSAKLAERALNELRTIQARLQGAEEALRASETRAMEAEARAQEAEEWLTRLYEAIQDRLLSRRDPFQSRSAAA